MAVVVGAMEWGKREADPSTHHSQAEENGWGPFAQDDTA
jgi:hypothetical protein